MTAKSTDIKRIAELARPRLEDITHHFLPGGQKKGNEYIVRNPNRADDSPGSFKINLDTGEWADFATGDKGGDMVSLLAFLDGGNQYEAAKRLAAFLGVEPGAAVRHRQSKQAKGAWTAIIPVPAAAPPPPAAHSTLGNPAGRWSYHDEAGQVVCYTSTASTP